MFKKFPDIFAINLRGNEIAEIEDKSFAENPKLEKIDLMENNLTKIAKQSLSGDFEDLQEINFSYNAISSIETGSFDKLFQLESIDLSFNCLKHLRSDLFKKNTELREVYLQDNVITRISHGLFNSKTDLKLLELSGNSLVSIPEFEMKKIKHLDLSRNNITELDLNYKLHEKKKSASISELILSFNQISVCHELEERRTDIVHLDLTTNLLEEMVDFPSFLNLEVLILANNNITDLSLHNFEDRFPSLKVLNVRHNPIDCSDFRYVRNNLQTIVVAADSALTNRCSPHSNSSSSHDDYDIYEDAIITEIRSKNIEVVKQLKLNRSLLIVLLSTFIVCLMVATLLLVQHRILLTKRSKEILIEQMEL